MWTSDRSRSCPVEEPAAGLGEVTLGDNPAGVYLEGERRWTQVYSPGGYCWRPALGDQVLVLKAGGERETPCIVGRKQAMVLEPGQVSISTGPTAIDLRMDGRLNLQGVVQVNGVELEALIASIVADILGGGEK